MDSSSGLRLYLCVVRLFLVRVLHWQAPCLEIYSLVLVVDALGNS